jgi:hypothetical protein
MISGSFLNVSSRSRILECINDQFSMFLKPWSSKQTAGPVLPRFPR